MTDNNETRILLDPPLPPASPKKTRKPHRPYFFASAIIILAFMIVVLSACAALSGLCVMFAFNHAIGWEIVRVGIGGLIASFCLIALATVSALIEGMARQ